MADHLRVAADVKFNTSHAVSDDAEEFREELSRISHEWDNVAHGWSWRRRVVVSPIWEEWHEGAAKIVEALADSSRRLGHAAVLYEEQDTNAAQTLVDSPRY